MIAMATLFQLLLLLFFFSDSFVSIHGIGVGINYGQIANNLPSPSHVVYLLRSLNVTRVKLYDADPVVLSAFANTGVEFNVGAGDVERMTDPNQAQAWIQQYVLPYVSQTKITCITVGNEVLTNNNTQLSSNLLPAMKTTYEALENLGLSKEISVSTAHSYGVLENSFPPSAGAFRQDLVETIRSILDFHRQTGSPFFINPYPFFTYKAMPEEVSLDYALFQPSSGMIDTVTNLHYDNMLYAQIDAVYYAIKALGYSDIHVKVSETGWPSKGDPNEAGATLENARLYNSNLLKRMEQNEGTPAKPSVPVDIYVFALFNENQKTGPASERNYGLFYPDGKPVYNIGLQQGDFIPHMEYSASKANVNFFVNKFLVIVALLICAILDACSYHWQNC